MESWERGDELKEVKISITRRNISRRRIELAGIFMVQYSLGKGVLETGTMVATMILRIYGRRIILAAVDYTVSGRH